MLRPDRLTWSGPLIPKEPLLNTYSIVKAEAGIVVLVAASLMGGCGSSSGSGNLFGSASNLTGNWQIETSASAASTSQQGVVLMGGLESSGNHVNGTFRFTNLADPDMCGSNQVVSLSGTVGSNGNLTLVSGPLPNNSTVKVSLKLGNAQPYSGLGTVEVEGGGSCALASASAIGSQVATTTGKFVGTLSPGPTGASSSSTPGTVAVALTQSASPGSDGQFTLTGTLNYQFASCAGSVPLNGKVSGVGMNFWDVVFTSTGDQVQASLVGTTNLTATQIKVGYLSLAPAPCSADPDSSAAFNGQITRK